MNYRKTAGGEGDDIFGVALLAILVVGIIGILLSWLGRIGPALSFAARVFLAAGIVQTLYAGAAAMVSSSLGKLMAVGVEEIAFVGDSNGTAYKRWDAASAVVFRCPITMNQTSIYAFFAVTFGFVAAGGLFWKTNGGNSGEKVVLKKESITTMTTIDGECRSKRNGVDNANIVIIDQQILRDCENKINSGTTSSTMGVADGGDGGDFFFR